MDEFPQNVVLTSRIDNGTDVDTPRSTNLYIVRLTSFHRRGLTDWLQPALINHLRGNGPHLLVMRRDRSLYRWDNEYSD